MDTEGLSIICAGLGIAEEDDDGRRIGYTKGEYCLDNLKDLLRFLRRDDPQTREVFKQVCRWNIVSKDLIPIMEHYQDDRNLVLNAVKVLVFLTMPIEPSSNDIPQQIEYLWGLKSSITCSNVVGVIVSLVEGPLENLECEAFTEDDWKLVQLVLTLFRNILAIQDMSLLQKAGGSATHFLSLRDRFLELLFHENVMDLIIVITQHVGGSSGYLHQDNLLLLETFYYIFSGQEPELIAKAHLKDSKMGADTKASLDNLKSIMKEEEEKRKLARLRNMSRHSQFSGTFTRLTMDGSKAVFKGNPSSVSQNLVKVPKGHSATKNSAIASEVPRPPHTPSHGAVSMSLPDPYVPPLPTPPQTPKLSLQPSLATLEPSLSLYKQRSWSPDIYRDEAWLRRKGKSKNRRSKSVTDEDLDELKACIELGFSFDSPVVDQRLSDTLPALGLYYAVNKHYNDTVSKSTSSSFSDCESPSPMGSPHAIFQPSDNPQTVKTRLRQWAQVVACTVRQSSC